MSNTGTIACLREAPAGRKQQALAEYYEKQGWPKSPMTHLAGTIEELGEIARELLFDDPNYSPRPDKHRGDLEHEMFDLLVYVCALATSCEIDLGI
jgi:NTP pyrophosphatase (non-canonical NTP hydrolase)